MLEIIEAAAFVDPVISRHWLVIIVITNKREMSRRDNQRLVEVYWLESNSWIAPVLRRSCLLQLIVSEKES